MEYANPIDLECPHCNHPVTTDRDFAEMNGRVFCTTCCKAFDVKIRKSQPDDMRNASWFKQHILGEPPEQEVVNKDAEQEQLPIPEDTKSTKLSDDELKQLDLYYSFIYTV